MKEEQKQVEAFVEAVNASKEEQEQTNQPLSAEEEEKKHQELLQEAWKDLDEKDKLAISTLIHLRNFAQGYIQYLSQKGKDWLAMLEK